jgi:hypothetical protein
MTTDEPGFPWISVFDERKPAYGEKCLVATPDEERAEIMWYNGPTFVILPETGTINKYRRERFVMHQDNEYGTGHIFWDTTDATHWMPWPKRPILDDEEAKTP